GRKTDILDCQWLQTLHTYGLLSGSFRPADNICVLRAYLRHRDNLISLSATHIHHMQKALSLMNLLLHNVISDITGVTGMRIIRAILAGERDRDKLANLKDHRIKNSAEIIAKSLAGDYRVEHLFTLRQAVELFDIYREKIDQCDEQILAYVRSVEAKVDLTEKPLVQPRRNKKPARNEPKQDLRPYLYRMTGVDLTKLPGINTVTAQIVLSEIGFDMSKWLTEKRFTRWLGLSPDNRISGGKILPRKSKKMVNRAAQALRLAAFN